ncbi:12233_t:CDS:2 [Funneliformis geosporum]|uniref:7368_t:CDS:1 n=1 Tax=Funneliformis geosporum TaxID=1117311 RepID=A0A9W4WHL6_9GLOM|nr:7368_t:CDS:2 [Funneliformis geosporum]CAI2162431.1 12233_t:CDS:2 [Funneliformis geosporum]
MVICHDDICSPKQGKPNSQNTCKGITSQGQPCKKVLLVSEEYCRHHKDQRAEENVFSIPITRKKNSSKVNDDLDEINNEFKSLSLNKSPSTRNDSSSLRTFLEEKQKTGQKYTIKELGEAMEGPYQSPISNIPNIKSPTPTNMHSSCINASHGLMTDNQKMTPVIIDLTDDDRKNGNSINHKIQVSDGLSRQNKKEIVESVEDELEKDIFVPDKATKIWIKYGEWIKPDLSPEIKRLLKSEIEKPITNRDKPGPNSEERDKQTFYKVGRSSNVHRRLYQWAKRCGNKPNLIELFPNVSNVKEDSCKSVESPKCKYTHRAERLIHIELNARFKADIEKCGSCGRLHKEWFKALSNSNDEFELHRWDEVREVITNWISFVETVYGTG